MCGRKTRGRKLGCYTFRENVVDVSEAPPGTAEVQGEALRAVARTVLSEAVRRLEQETTEQSEKGTLQKLLKAIN